MISLDFKVNTMKNNIDMNFKPFFIKIFLLDLNFVVKNNDVKYCYLFFFNGFKSYHENLF